MSYLQPKDNVPWSMIGNRIIDKNGVSIYVHEHETIYHKDIATMRFIVFCVNQLTACQKELERADMENDSLSIGLKGALDYYGELYTEWEKSKKELAEAKKEIASLKEDTTVALYFVPNCGKKIEVKR